MGGSGLLGRLAVGLAIVALALVPISYAWVLDLPLDDATVFAILALSELGAIVFALGAMFLGFRARRRDPGSLDGIWAPRLGALAILLVIVPNLVGALLAR